MTPDFNPMVRIILWNSMGFFFFSFLIPYVSIQLLGASPSDLGIFYSFQTIGSLISAPIVGYLTDHISKKFLVLVGSFGRATCYILMYFGIILSSLMLFVVGMLVLGFFAGFFWTPLDTLISEKSNKVNRSFAFGKRFGMIGIGNLIGSGISYFIFSFSNTFMPENLFLVYSPLLLFASSNIFGGFMFHFKVDEKLTFEKHIFNLFPSVAEEHILSNEPVMIETPLKSSINLTIGFFVGFSVLAIALMTSNINAELATPFFQPYLVDKLNINNPSILMLIYLPSQIVSMLLAPLIGKLADKINPVLGVVIVSSLGASLTFLLLNSTSGYMFSILLLLDSTFGRGGNLILQNILSRISKIHRGKVFGAAEALGLLGAILGPLIGGFTYVSIGSFAPFVISIFVELSVIPLYAIAIKKLKPYMTEKID